MTDPPFVETTARRRDVTMNTTAEIVVSFERKVAAPRLPNSVWLEPPKAAPISAPLLLCIRTINIRKKQTILWIIKRNVVIAYPS
jgi:hypothetical protein